MPDISELDSLLDDGGKEFSTIDPAIVKAGEDIAQTMLKAGFDSWGTFISRGVIFQPTGCKFTSPADSLEDVDEKFVELVISWNGDRDGFFHLLIPEQGVRGAIAYFLALALGSEPDIENTKLDAEGMDAFSELANTLVQQGAQALRASPAAGGKIELKIEKTRVLDFSSTTVEAELGIDDLLCQTGQLTIEGLPPMTVRMLMSVSCTGMTAELKTTSLHKNTDDLTSELRTAARGRGPRYRNEHIAMRLPLPVVVVLATTKKRVENIKELAPGSIIEFRKFAGEFLDVCAGNTKIAEGEVVIVNQHFGIQLRKITPRIPPAKAIRNRPYH